MRIWHHKALLISLFAFFVTIFGAQSSYAAEPSAPGIQVSPTQQSLTLDPGQTQTGTFTVTNIGSDTVKVNFSATPYYPADQSYNPDYDIVNTYTKLSQWVTFDQDTAEIAPDDNFTVHFTITVPEDVPAGGQYAALFAETTDTQGGGNFNAKARVGTLLLAQVNGDTRTAGELLSQDFPTFSLGSAPVFQSTVQNTGNVDFRTSTTLRIQGVISRQVFYDNADTPITASVLPDSTRYIAITPDNLPAIGLFQATYTISFLGADHTIDKVFFIIPTWLVLAVVFVVIFIIILVILHFTKRRHRLV